MKTHITTRILFLLLLSVSPLIVLAQTDEELTAFGIEVEKVLNLGSGILASALSVLTVVTYSRTRNKRLLYVGVAFVLFAIKSLLVGVEIFFGEWSWVDNFSSIADFFILLCFFLGIIKK